MDLHVNFEKTYKEVSAKIGKNVIINPELCLYTPSDVTKALLENKNIKKWLKYISNHYIPEKKDILLTYPCSTVKPYSSSRSYKILNKTLELIDPNRTRIQVMTISEPFGLVPEEYYGINTEWHDWENDWYDCPGLFEWWCKKYGFEYNYNDLDESINILAGYVSKFFKKVDSLNIYSKKIALIRTYSSSYAKKTDHTHRRIIEMARDRSGTEIEILPDLKTVKQVVEERGRFAWDMYGVAHPLVQEMIYKKLKSYLES